MRRYLLPLALALVLTGCSTHSFVGRRLDNFRAYYNTFYNARRTFNEAQDDKSARQAIDRDQFLPLYHIPALSSAKPYDDAIKKSADVLRAHPDSKWVDDALLLIGKSYYYQRNFVGAEQKFREVIQMGSRLADEARFWLARSLVEGGTYDAAAAHLAETLSRQDLSRRWEPQIRLVLGELYVKRKDWASAAEQLENGLARVRDREAAARAQYLLGQVHEASGAHDKAIAAFERAARYAPRFELAFAAQIDAIRVEGFHGDVDRALTKLRRMERDDKNYTNRSEMAYLRGRLFQAAKRPNQALDTYHKILYEADSDISGVRGYVHYSMGEIYRDTFKDFVLAAAYFDTARTAMQGRRSSLSRQAAGGRSVIQPTYTAAAITDEVQQATMFKSFAAVRSEVSRMDSLLDLGMLDDAAFEKAIYDLRVKKAEQQEAERRELERRQAQQGFQNIGGAGVGQRSSDQGAGPSDAQAGFLFHKNQSRVQDMWASFVDRWGERPLVPNWRRLDAISGADVAGPDSVLDANRTTRGRRSAAIQLPEIDTSGIPRDSARQAEMRSQRALARYELGNVLFLSMQRPDSAATWYRMVIEEDPSSEVAQRAYYALAEVQRAKSDSAAAEAIYRDMLTRYPESEFSDRIKEQLGIPVASTRGVADSLALAEQAYARGQDLWRAGQYPQAIEAMVQTVASFRDTEIAPRALLAAGNIAAEWAVRDSIPIGDQLPLLLPDSLIDAANLRGSTPASAPDSVAADSLQIPGTPISLFYSALARNYGRSAYADHARRVLKALAENGAPVDAPPAAAEPPAAQDPERRLPPRLRQNQNDQNGQQPPGTPPRPASGSDVR